MKFTTPFLSAALAVAVRNGCVPFRGTKQTGAVGRVLDAQSGAPVAQALVSTSGIWDERWELHGRSSSDGSFRVAPVRQWGILPLIASTYPRRWETAVTISAPGFGVHTSLYPATAFGPSVVEMGDVRLTPVAPWK
jgi:hypothetical protein